MVTDAAGCPVPNPDVTAGAATGAPDGFYTQYSKRMVDVAVASLGLVVLSPVVAGLAAVVRWRLGGPVLFRQQRPGRHAQPFELVKFRTMTDARDERGRLLADNQRLTPFGAFLRSTSLDELPELVNVVRGDMSLVGPRPLLTAYLDLYDDHQARRHEVRPGITGWAQVNGRNATSWQERFRLDVYYVDNVSLRLDLKILWRSLRAVASREGITGEGHVTMEPFTGTN